MAKVALCAAVPIGNSDGAAPAWLHLLPAGEIGTVDGRGPFRVADARALVAASMAGGKLVLDENHATDLAAPKGLPAPARGWIVQLQHRADGIWGQVKWTDEARRAEVWRAYRGVSPVIAHKADGTVLAIARASLTNVPNLTGLTALHSQGNTVDLRSQLIPMLGLAAAADDRAILSKVAEMVKLQAGKDLAAISAQQEGAKLALQARTHQRKLADMGIAISLPAAVHAVHAVRDGKAV